MWLVRSGYGTASSAVGVDSMPLQGPGAFRELAPGIAVAIAAPFGAAGL